MPPSGVEIAAIAAYRVQTAACLAERMRLGFALCAAALALFAGVNLVAHRDQLLILWALGLVQVAILVAAFVAIRGVRSRRFLATVGLLVLLGVEAAGLVCDWLSVNQLGTALGGVGAAMTTAALLPWGAVPQALAATIAALGALTSVVLVGGSFVDVAIPGAVGITLLACSVFVAWSSERMRQQRAFTEAALTASTRRAEREARIASVLARASETVAAHLDDPDMLDRLHAIAREALGVDWSGTFLLDDHSAGLRLAAAVGVSEEIRDAVAEIEVPVVAFPEVDADGVFEMPDASAQRRMPFRHLARIGVSSFVGAPLSCRGKLLGLQVHGYRQRIGAFAADDRRLVAGLAHATALAMENARRIAGLEAASQLKTEFVATMSHELRTPLNVITGYTEMLSDDSLGPLTPVQRETLARVRQSADELLALVNATLDVGRLEAGRVPVEREPVDVQTLLSEVDVEVRPLLVDGVVLRWRTRNLGSLVLTDRTKLKTIVKNLAGNACKFTRRGSIDVAASWHDGVLEVCVRDTGIGIAEDQVPHIFDMFRQGDASATRRFGGVGLGLHIVRRLVDLLGGSVSVASRLDEGSEFVVRLPVPLALRVADGRRAAG